MAGHILLVMTAAQLLRYTPLHVFIHFVSLFFIFDLLFLATENSWVCLADNDSDATAEVYTIRCMWILLHGRKSSILCRNTLQHTATHAYIHVR